MEERAWTPPSRDRSAHALPRREVPLAADGRGIATIPAPRQLARLAGVSTHTAWHWLRGQRVSEMDRAIRAALNLPLRAA